MREILVDWVTPSGGGKVSVFYADDLAAVAGQRAALGTFLDEVGALLNNDTSWTIRQTGREIDPSTGGLTGEWDEGTVQAGTGGNAGQPVADATQVLLRWTTGQVVGGRFLKGRTYIPGLATANLTDGNISAAVTNAIIPAMAAFIATGTGFQIWHRPTSGSGGSAHDVTGGSVWNELAVLRRRRG